VPGLSDQADITPISELLKTIDKTAGFAPFIKEYTIPANKWGMTTPSELKPHIKGYHVSNFTINSNPGLKYTKAFGTVKIDNTAKNIKMLEVAARCNVVITKLDVNTVDNRDGTSDTTCEITVQARSAIPSVDIEFEIWVW
jgi:hypothetical protein